jgi:hypothetical protein
MVSTMPIIKARVRLVRGLPRGASAIRLNAIHGTNAVRSVITFIVEGDKDLRVNNSFVSYAGS